MSQFGVDRPLECSAQSSDLEPIQHLWDELECGLWAGPDHPSSELDFTNALMAKAKQIPAAKSFF